MYVEHTTQMASSINITTDAEIVIVVIVRHEDRK